jgi:hypothetical protein
MSTLISYTLFNSPILNLTHKRNIIHFIYNRQDSCPAPMVSKGTRD